jgi:transcriptional regulator
MTNSDKLAILLKRKRGVTAAEVARELPTTSPHSSISRMQYTHNWTVTKKTRPDGQKIYFGTPPKGTK